MKRSLVVSLFLVVSLIPLSRIHSAAVEVGWITAEAVSFKMEREFSDVSLRPAATYGGNTNCSKRTVLTKSERQFVGLAAGGAQYAEDCMNDAVYGAVGGTWLVRSGTSVAGPLTLRTNKEFIIGGPNVSTGILGDATAPIGVYLNFAQNLDSQLKTEPLSNGTVRHSLKNNNEIVELKNAKNERLVANLDTIAFSSNGDYVVFDSPYYGLVRMDTKTSKIVSFGAPTNYNGGFNPGYQLAISSDGRWVAHAGNGLFNIYDLSSCSGQNLQHQHLVSCQTRSFEDLRLQKANYGQRPSHIRFTGSGSISYYAGQNNGQQVIYRQYLMSINGQEASRYKYLALGDSYASGEGAFKYKALTDMDNNRCHNSLSSYGFLLGRQLGYGTYESVACSGATIEDVTLNTLQEDFYQGQYQDGLTQIGRDIPAILNQFLPGKITQNTFVDHYNPEAVTISIGGNDLGFADKLKHCIIGVVPSLTCFDSESERRAVASEVYELTPRLISTYQKLKADNKRVYVIGYPKIAAAQGNCAVNVRLNADELAFADRLTTLLNDAIEFSAAQAGVKYVDVENILVGRRLCETHSDNALVHGITQARTGGKLGVYYVAQESFHPKADAQALYRDAITSQTNSLTAGMPAPAVPAQFPRLLSTDDFFTGLRSGGGVEYKPKYHDMLPNRVIRGTDWPIQLDGNFTGLPELSSVRVEIHSSPRELGVFNTDEQGNLNETIIVPSDLEPGYHSIHVYGTNLVGERIDIYDYLLVAHNTVDLDGDQIYDRDEGCVFGEPSGIDSDNNSTDDICQAMVEKIETIDSIDNQSLEAENGQNPEVGDSSEQETLDPPVDPGNVAINEENEVTPQQNVLLEEVELPTESLVAAVLPLNTVQLTGISILPRQPAFDTFGNSIGQILFSNEPAGDGPGSGVVSDFAASTVTRAGESENLAGNESAKTQTKYAVAAVIISGSLYLVYWLFKVRNEFKKPGSEY